MNEKVKGVYLDKRTNKWKPNITVDGKRKHLGYFATYEEAVAVRKEAEIEYGFVSVTTPLNLKDKDDLTQQMLKDQLHYDKETGIFTRLVKTAISVKIGSIAGSINDQGYTIISIGNKNYRAHRLAFLYMEGKFPEDGLEVDHINHVRNDNKWENLRIVTHQENGRNYSMSKRNKAGYTGVHWNKSRNKWMSSIMGSNGKSEHLGLFETKEEAVAARKQAEIKYNFHENHGKLKPNQIKEVI